ncbi:MAG: glycoside hydrolase family 43 protein [Alistipes sp.]|uniref:glycoside hydrolase family 43 protein n=1 Tax=Alistipes sp. TaxID=1872444 RepID=UPI0025B8597D|nr:glycoside hydrolase family 43 protein [Alistipes sp.]MCD8273889.1 glycoside hydrolase family 43 protein [Alistipes sp.]
MNRSSILRLVIPVLCMWGGESCRFAPAKKTAPDAVYTNPVYTQNSNTSITYHEGLYYYLQDTRDKLLLYVSEDPTDFDGKERHVICDVPKDYNLHHHWHPQIVPIDGTWYIYFAADDGNTDNHQLYVLENPSPDPTRGKFRMKGRISTDPENNWAIHAHVFPYEGAWYMAWSGWETRRIFAETQCLYIARMKNPWTLDTPRMLISKPEYEWECQWINPDGSTRIAYPLMVNESPFFFCNDSTDKAYLYYSASASWTPYYSIGQLSAPKGSDLLDPASWTKRPKPVLAQNREEDIYGPGYPFIIPSPDSTEYYLVYMARSNEINMHGNTSFGIYMQKIAFGDDGAPEIGEAVARGVPLPKPSGLRTADK